jgi:hypothetical protein
LCVKFNSTHSLEELNEACLADLKIFRAVPGLIQKYYIAEENTEAISGIYLFETKNARADFWASDLAKAIPARYGMIPDTIRIENFDVLIVLNEVEST